VDCLHCENTRLVMSERQGIEIDYCPQCRGVWLDRGELEKIIERISNEYGDKQNYHNNDNEKHHYKHHDKNHGRHFRKRSLLASFMNYAAK
jgi:Zn-finger nucleic acid-binding protein